MNLKHIKQSIFAVLVTSLSLSVFAAPQDDVLYEENDTRLTAYDHTLGENSTIAAVSMDEDWYKIEAKVGTNRLQIDLWFSDIEDDLELYLVDDTGVILTSSTSSTDNESITFDADPAGGIYYIAVASYNNNYPADVAYTLFWDDVALVGDDLYEDNDTETTAYDLSLDAGVWLSSVLGLGIASDDDWYKIEVPVDLTQIQINATFAQLDDDLDVYLYDAAGINVLASSTSATDNESINVDVGVAGIYLVMVTAATGAGAAYDLRWDGTEVPPTGSFDFISLLLLPLIMLLRRKMSV